MEIRVESFKLELEKHSYFFDKHIDSSHWQILDELDKINAIEDQINEIKSNSNNLSNFKDLLKNFPLIRALLNDISTRLFSLSHTAESFRASRRKFPKYKNILIGKLTSPLRPVDLVDLKYSESTFIDLSDEIANLSSIYQLENNNFLALDSYLNSIVEFDSKFNFVRNVCLNDLAGVRFQKISYNSNFYGLLASKKSIYINNMEHNEIIIVDRALTRIEKIFSPAFSIDRPIFLCERYRDSLFILSYVEKLILEYDYSGNKIGSIKLDEFDIECYEELREKTENFNQLVTICNSFTINDKFVACSVAFLTEVHIYDLSGKLCQKLQMGCDKTSLCLADDFLVCYTRWTRIGSILVHELKVKDDEESKSDSDSENQSDTKQKERVEDLSLLKFSSWCCKKDLKAREKFSYMFSHKSILYYQNCLMIFFSRECLVVLIHC
jgi:hypothetical protein